MYGSIQNCNILPFLLSVCGQIGSKNFNTSEGTTCRKPWPKGRRYLCIQVSYWEFVYQDPVSFQFPYRRSTSFLSAWLLQVPSLSSLCSSKYHSHLRMCTGPHKLQHLKHCTIALWNSTLGLLGSRIHSQDREEHCQQPRSCRQQALPKKELPKKSNPVRNQICSMSLA